MNLKTNKKKCIISIFILIFIIYIGTSIGSSNISMLDTISIIANKTFGITLRDGVLPKDVSIIWKIRLPRVLLAFLVGGCLATSGAVVQSILKNQLASPYTLGVSSGASLGAGLVIITGITIPVIGSFTLPFVGFIFGLFTVYLVILFSSKIDKRIALWQMGSFAMKGWTYVGLIIPFCLVGMIGTLMYTKEMDILTFGEEQAQSVGVDTSKVKTKLFIFSAVLTGGAVSLSGTIGFVDLIAPHVVRKIFGSNHKYVIPMSFVFGGCLMVVTDLIARSIFAPTELPVGAVTALIGAPFFAYVYFKKAS